MGLFAFLWILLVTTVCGTAVNRTIDDQNGDEVTGLMVRPLARSVGIYAEVE